MRNYITNIQSIKTKTADSDRYIDHLQHIPCELCSYDEWVHVGMALHSEGYPLSVWVDWSRTDPDRFNEGECERKWDSFSDDNAQGITGGTIIHLARRYGYNGPSGNGSSMPHKPERRAQENKAPLLDIDKDAPWPQLSDMTPAEQLLTYLDALGFTDDERVYIAKARYATSADSCRQVSEVRAILEQPDGFERLTHGYSTDDGCWICVNPMDGNGRKDANVVCHRNALVESDDIPIDEQKRVIAGLMAAGLPVRAVVNSGGKSLHAIVSIGADDEREYSRLVKSLYELCDANGLEVDHKDGNPSRLTRLPGATRGDRMQTLVIANPGVSSYKQFIKNHDFINKNNQSNDVINDCSYDSKNNASGITVKLPDGRANFGKKASFDHEAAALHLINEQHMRLICNIPCIWDEKAGAYRSGSDAISSAILHTIEGTTSGNRNETIATAKILARDGASYSRVIKPTYIAVRNGTLDALTGELLEPDPRYNVTNPIPVRWNPDARSELLEETLEALADGDPATLANLYETVALCAVRDRSFQLVPFLIGEGGTGKSTFLSLIMRLLGSENYSSLDMTKMGVKFQQEAFIGKLANICDDNSAGSINADALGVLKSATGDGWFSSEIKGKETYSTYMWGACVFSANGFPSFTDPGGALKRRLVPISFTHKFYGSDSIDRDRSAKLDSDEVSEALLVHAVRAYQEMRKRGGMTPNPISDRIREEVAEDNDTVSLWVNAGELDNAFPYNSDKIPTAKLYAEYCKYCRTNGIGSPVQRRVFTSKIKKMMGYTSNGAYYKGDHVQCFFRLPYTLDTIADPLPHEAQR